MRLVNTIIISVVSLILPSLSAQPADLNFDPIVVQVWQLSKELNQVSVLCDAKDGTGQSINVSYVQAANTSNSVYGDLDASKNYSGNLQAGLNFNNPADAAKAKTYSCSLRLTCSCNLGNCRGACTGNAAGIIRDAEIGNGSEWWHVKAGTITMSGPIWSPQSAPQPLKTFEAWGFPN